MAEDKEVTDQELQEAWEHVRNMDSIASFEEVPDGTDLRCLVYHRCSSLWKDLKETKPCTAD